MASLQAASDVTEAFDSAARWGRIREALKAEFGPRTFSSWLSELTFVGIDHDTAVLNMPTAFKADWVRSHYVERLRLLWGAGGSPVRNVRIESGVRTVSAVPDAQHIEASEPVVGNPAESASRQQAASDPDAQNAAVLNPRYTFEAFVVGKANELAYGAAKAVAEGGDITFNPLFLHGITGIGKTHLMHAIGWEFRRRDPSAKVVYMSAEKFMCEFLAAMRAKDTLSFKRRLRTADLLLIDDIQFIGGKESTQEEMFHTMNEIIAAERPLVISADRPPQDLDGIEARVRSRLAWGLVADINPAEYELRLNILNEKLTRMGFESNALVSEEVVDFLARKVTGNIRELEGALNRVIAYSKTRGSAIDVATARQVLSSVLRSHSRRVTVDRIQREVAEFYHIKLSDMLSARRARDVARPRQIAMYLAKRLTPRSLPDIGKRFGGRDHTTVMHAVKRIEELRAGDGELSADIERLERIIDC
ncbi:chromosomal replication initiation protein DnaA [Pacificimonas flava]|uniref:Chromosomal replication initiator protein DnaA n=2 Tax=Pacificimonas TaxID=1960290 RepID=A0A219B3C4_9SPHN|nr:MULTISPECIES: chromosomal replication initiator protein DnaA [Pacificimonas]MBZ6377464.1 chromosomal replication initiator protein DnaA [Pacificimonas aurantium]OWV32837.1 chromosomal replication initiation protein DnaA [Pacificimonas flava]